MNAWDSTPPATWPALDDIMAMTWGEPEDWEAIAIPVISLAEPQAGPADTFWLDLASGDTPNRGHMIMLAGLAEGYATQPTGFGYVRLAVAKDEHGSLLVTCRRLPTRDRLGGYPADYRAYGIGGNGLLPCCERDGDARQELCGELPEPWSRHCAAHQDAEDARRRVAAWQRDSIRVRDERDPMVHAAVAAGITKHSLYLTSGIARTTIDDILAGPAPQPPDVF
jgi:hypothetical protein